MIVKIDCDESEKNRTSEKEAKEEWDDTDHVWRLHMWKFTLNLSLHSRAQRKWIIV